MGLLLPLKSLLLAILRLLKRRRVKQLAAATGLPDKRIGGIERGTVKNVLAEELELLFISMSCSEAEVVIVSACLEALDGLDPAANPAEAAAQERFVAGVGRDLRRRMRWPGSVAAREYPLSHEVEPDRAEARDTWTRLREVKTLREMALAVRVGREHHRWALVELLCDESERAASKDAGRARDLALTAVRIARHLRVREGWRRRLLGFAAAHLANALRVANHLVRAERTLAAARRLWDAGEDPDRRRPSSPAACSPGSSAPSTIRAWPSDWIRSRARTSERRTDRGRIPRRWWAPARPDRARARRSRRESSRADPGTTPGRPGGKRTAG